MPSSNSTFFFAELITSCKTFVDVTNIRGMLRRVTGHHYIASSPTFPLEGFGVIWCAFASWNCFFSIPFDFLYKRFTYLRCHLQSDGCNHIIHFYWQCFISRSRSFSRTISNCLTFICNRKMSAPYCWENVEPCLHGTWTINCWYWVEYGFHVNFRLGKPALVVWTPFKLLLYEHHGF